MGVLLKKQSSGLAFTGIARIGIIAFIVAISSASVGTIWSIYINSFVNNASLVGFISAFLSIIAFFSYFLIIPLVEKSNKAQLFALILFLISISYFLFSLNKNFYIFLLIAVVYTFFVTTRITCFRIIVKDKSKNYQLSRNEGIIYTFTNLAWIIGPLIAGFILANSEIKTVFIFSSLFMLIAFLMLKFSGIKDKHINKKTHSNIKENFFEFFKDKKRRLAYILSGGVNLWWVLIYTFTPILILNQGLNEQWVAYFLFLIPLPLIFLEYRFAKMAGKYGFRKMFNYGFFIAFVIALSCFFISNIYIILALLILASFGLAMVEPTTEAYFFDITTKEEEQRFYGPYNTTIEVNLLIGQLSSAFLLYFMPFKFIFLLFAIFMFALFLISFKTKKIVEEKKKFKFFK
jgi:MFS family permease